MTNENQPKNDLADKLKGDLEYQRSLDLRRK